LSLLTSRVPEEEGYFLLLASPGVEPASTRIIPKDVVFVLDTSGSMAGQKLEQAKKALLFCVENLNEDDRFEVLRFSTDVDQLFDNTVKASPENRARAGEFIRRLKPLGGTAIDNALQRAFSLAPSRDSSHGRVLVIIFLTDGRPTVGITREEEILERARQHNSQGTRVFTFGIGTDVNTHLLDKLTEDARGFTQYVLPEEDLEIKVSSFFTKIKQPVLANPTLKFTGGIRVSQTYPSPLPDLFQGEQVVLVGRYSGRGDSAIVLEGNVDGATHKYTYEASWDSAESHSFIPRLWATRRVGFLLDEIRLRGENSELRDEVVELARKYGIVTPYTAYLIVEDEDRRQVPTSFRSIQNFENDREARAEAARSWSQFKTEKAGEAAVADALSGQALRMAQAPASATARGNEVFLRRYGMVSQAGDAVSRSAPAAAGRIAQYSQQSQFVGGKNFFQRGNQWIDSAVQANVNRERVRVLVCLDGVILNWAGDAHPGRPRPRGVRPSGDQCAISCYENRVYEIYE